LKKLNHLEKKYRQPMHGFPALWLLLKDTKEQAKERSTVSTNSHDSITDHINTN
jgi:hypothetical protein